MEYRSEAAWLPRSLKAWQPTPVFLPGESHEESGGLQSIGSQIVRHDQSDLAHTHMHAQEKEANSSLVSAKSSCLPLA